MRASHRDPAIGGESGTFYYNATHWRAIDGIVDGVAQRVGLMALTGPTGSGKTVLIRTIMEQLGENVRPHTLQYASLSFREFINFLYDALGVENEVPDAPNKAVALRQFLEIEAARGETSAVFIDDAQNLTEEVAKMLPRLARITRLKDGTVVGCQFILIGSEGLESRHLDAPDSPLGKALTRRYNLRFLNRSEMEAFLRQRLAPIARMVEDPIEPGAVDAVALYTGGSPRLIAKICSHAMLFAAENPGSAITAAMITEAAQAQMMEPKPDAIIPDEDIEISLGPADGRRAAAARPAAATEAINAEREMRSARGDDDLYADEADLDPAAAPRKIDRLLDRVASATGHARDEEDADFEDEAHHGAAGGGIFARLSASFKRGGPSRADIEDDDLMDDDERDAKRSRVARATAAADAKKAQKRPQRALRKTRAVVAGRTRERVRIAAVAAGAAVVCGTLYIAVPYMMKAAASAYGSALQLVERATPEQPPIYIPPSETVTQSGGGGWGARVETVAVDGVSAVTEQIGQPAVDYASDAIERMQALNQSRTGGHGGVIGAMGKATGAVLASAGELFDAAPDASEADSLAMQGEKLFAERRYIEPFRENAYYYYRKALKANPTQPVARAGVEKLRDHYSKMANEARANQAWELANGYFNTAIAISRLDSL